MLLYKTRNKSGYFELRKRIVKNFVFKVEIMIE